MTKQAALNALDYFRQAHAATDNTTLGDLANNYWTCGMADDLRDSFANLTWDTSLAEAREIIQAESE